MKYRDRVCLNRILVFGLALVSIPFLIYKAFHPQIEKSFQRLVEPHPLPNKFQGLVPLKPSELQKLQDSTTRFIVVFYAPGNSYNLEYLEEFNHLAESITADIRIRNGKLEGAAYRYDPIVFGVVDCAAFGELCNEGYLHLYGYPTTVAFNFKSHDIITKSSKWDSFRLETLTSDIVVIKNYIKEFHFTHRMPSFFYDSSTVVTELSDTELQEIIETDNHKHIAVIIFYVPWCPHCKGFVDRFNEIADTFHQRRVRAVVDKRTELRTFSTEVDNLDRTVLFAAINCDVFRDTCFGHGLPIEYYPTIIAFNMNRDKLVEAVPRDKLEDYLDEMYFLNKGPKASEVMVVVNESEI